MDFNWALRTMHGGGWVTRSSKPDPTYRMTLCDDADRFQRIIAEIRNDGNEGLSLEFDGLVCIERTGKANVCISSDIDLAGAYAEDWKLWRPTNATK